MSVNLNQDPETSDIDMHAKAKTDSLVCRISSFCVIFRLFRLQRKGQRVFADLFIAS
jgi:hypothetical protein